MDKKRSRRGTHIDRLLEDVEDAEKLNKVDLEIITILTVW
jgi:hypothetical protein